MKNTEYYRGEVTMVALGSDPVKEDVRSYI